MHGDFLHMNSDHSFYARAATFFYVYESMFDDVRGKYLRAGHVYFDLNYENLVAAYRIDAVNKQHVHTMRHRMIGYRRKLRINLADAVRMLVYPASVYHRNTTVLIEHIERYLRAGLPIDNGNYTNQNLGDKPFASEKFHLVHVINRAPIADFALPTFGVLLHGGDGELGPKGSSSHVDVLKIKSNNSASLPGGPAGLTLNKPARVALAFHGDYARGIQSRSSTSNARCSWYWACSSNIRTNVIESLRKIDVETSVYFHTMHYNLEYDKSLVLDLDPVGYEFTEKLPFIVDFYRRVLSLVAATFDGDTIILLRFDVIYRRPIASLPIDWTMLNYAFRDINSKQKTSDLFFVLPSHFMSAFDDALLKAHTENRSGVEGTGHLTLPIVTNDPRIGLRNVKFIDPVRRGSRPNTDRECFLTIKRACPPLISRKPAISEYAQATPFSRLRHLEPVFWLHVPKCGTSFDKTQRQYPRFVSRGKGMHQSPTKEEDCTVAKYSCADEQQATVTILRGPAQRLLSAYRWINTLKARGVSSCCGLNWGWSNDVSVPVKSEIRKGAPPWNTIGRFPGCITRMILGYGCMEISAPAGGLNQTHIELATARVANFKFVGETSHWRLSVCLFNKIMTGSARVFSWQLTQTPPGERGAPKHDRAADLLFYNDSEVPGDWADNAVYEYAMKRFRTDLQAQGLLRALNSNEALVRLCPISESKQRPTRPSEVNAKVLPSLLPPGSLQQERAVLDKWLLPYVNLWPGLAPVVLQSFESPEQLVFAPWEDVARELNLSSYRSFTRNSFEAKWRQLKGQIENPMSPTV